jgi:hypothetical protein
MENDKWKIMENDKWKMNSSSNLTGATTPVRRLDLKRTQAARLNTIRDINRQIVLNYVREREPISRAEIARETQLQRSTNTPDNQQCHCVSAGIVKPEQRLN